MARNFELDSLREREQEAFDRKQLAFKRYVEAKELASKAYTDMQSAWEERRSALEDMNSEYEAMKRTSDHYGEVWDEYGRIRDSKNAQKEALVYEADHEHELMVDCFNRASDAYQYGDKSEAPIYSAEGHEHKERRDELHAEISRIVQEIRDAKANAEFLAPKTDSSAFHRAREVYRMAKARHQSAEDEFKRLKVERDSRKAEFDFAQEEYIRARDEFRRKLAEVKANNQRERDRTLDEAGINWLERDDAKIVKKPDGSTQVYHGGLGSGDGFGHGHTALDASGNKTYDRDAFSPHGGQNFTGGGGNGGQPNNPGAKPSNGGWTPIEHGVIFDQQGKDYPVSFRQGLGDNEGQTLIRDGYVKGRPFHDFHNHYGLNDKSRFPDKPDRIEDSDKHKDDTFYTGPGH